VPKIFNPLLNALARPFARRLDHDHMSRLGIERTMKLALRFNRLKHRAEDEWRREMYQFHFRELLEENGPIPRTPIEVHDGWAVDTSMSLPHLDALLEQGDRIVEERCGVQRKAVGHERVFFQNLFKRSDLTECPAFLDFATSSEIVSVIADSMLCVPRLSTSHPSGVRLVESNEAYNDRPGLYRDSQLYHIDYYSMPNLYVIVLLRDTTLQSGPWHFLPRSVSQRAKRELGYWQKGKWGYRVPDEEMYKVVDRDEVLTFDYPRGSVLFIESSGCFHFGSRDAVVPRYQVMYAYTGACRTDFKELFSLQRYPIRPADSRLRKMVLGAASARQLR